MLVKVLNHFKHKYPEKFDYEFRLDGLHMLFNIYNSVTDIRVPVNVEGRMLGEIIYPKFVLNQNGTPKIYPPEQIRDIILFKRLEQILNYPIPDISLLQDDIIAFINTGCNTLPHSPNASLKVKNRAKVLKSVNPRTNMPFQVFGDSIRRSNVKCSQEEIEKNIHWLNPMPASEDNPSKGVYILNTGEPYDAIGYQEKDGLIHTIFDTVKKRSSIPARLKSHVAADYIPVCPRKKKIYETTIGEDGKKVTTEKVVEDTTTHYRWLKPTKDSPDTLKGSVNAIVVFAPIDEKSGEFVCGEIHASKRFSSRIMNPTNTQIIEATKTLVNEGQEISRKTPIAVNLSMPEGKQEVFMKFEFNKAEVLKVEQISPVDPEKGTAKFRLKFKGYTPMGACRLISDTGIKGVTIPKSHLGYIKTKEKDYEVDLVMGPNSIKAGYNTIALARLGLWAYHNQQQVCVNDAISDPEKMKELNQKIRSMRKVLWMDKYGNEQMVWAGMVNVQITELSSEHFSIGSTKMLPEGLKHFQQNGGEELVDLLLKHYITDQDKAGAIELSKILLDTDAKFAEEDGLKVYATDEVQEMLYGQVLQLSIFGKKHEDTCLLGEANKGYYIAFRPDLCVRIPSRKLILSMSDELHTGEWRYPKFYQKAIQLLLDIRANKWQRIYANNGSLSVYLAAIQAQLEGKNHVISKTCTPETYGCVGKQIVSEHVPQGVTVVMNDYFHKILNKRLELEGQDKPKVPVNDDDIEIQNIGDQDQLEPWRGKVREIGMRNPIIWRFQMGVREIWNRFDFEMHLMLKGIDINDVIDPHLGRYLILRNHEDALADQSDCDGDIFPVIAPAHPKVQMAMENLFLDEPRPYEQEWTNQYISGEMDNSKLEPPNPEEPLNITSITREEFNRIFSDSAKAKMEMGIATLAMWEWYGYCQYVKAKNCINQDTFNKFTHVYSRLVQDKVVRGIKHVAGGSQGFQIFYLDNMIKPANRKEVSEELAFCGLEPKEIEVFFSIAQLSQNKQISNLVKSVVGLTNGYAFNPKILVHQDSTIFAQNKFLSYLRYVVDRCKDSPPSYLLSTFTEAEEVEVSDMEDTGWPCE